MKDIGRLKALCEKYPDMVVTREDSHNAGNCTFGTAEFVENHFPTRETITVRELAKFIRVSGVQEVLWYKLRQFAEPVFYLWYRGANHRWWTRLDNDGYGSEADAASDKLML